MTPKRRRGVRLEFRLTMPGRGRAVSSSFGEGRNYLKFETVSKERANELLNNYKGSWFHHWSDGWAAHVTARALGPGERRSKTDGFAGYDWMVDNIIRHGATTAPGESPA